MAEQFQVIVLCLKDGRRIEAMVKAFCTEDDVAQLNIQSVEVSAPRDLPPGCNWGPLMVEEEAQEEACTPAP